MPGTKSNNVTGHSIDQILTKVEAEIAGFEAHLNAMRYEEAKQQSESISRLVRTLPRVSPHVTTAHKNWLAACLDRLNIALARFDVAGNEAKASPSQHSKAINAYWRFR
jgi:hypothetical protein